MAEKNLNTWMKRFGAIGFLFFLAKGLVWLALAGIAAFWMK